MSNRKYRNLVFFKDYFQSFFEQLPPKVKTKIIWTLQMIEDLPRVPESYLKHMEGTSGIYEIRVQSGSNIYRIFCFFDKGSLVVISNGFQKKTQKTPKHMLALAIKIKAEYESEEK